MSVPSRQPEDSWREIGLQTWLPPTDLPLVFGLDLEALASEVDLVEELETNRRGKPWWTEELDAES